MSTIKSSDEHLTLNADGSSKDIKFQANGVEKASISSSGAFTSTTIDATALTGNLPAISGASLTGVLPLAGGTLTGDVNMLKTSGNSEFKVEASGTDAYATVRVKNDAKDYSMQIRSDQSDAWTIRDETAGANRLMIDTSGAVTMPTQPAFRAGGDSNGVNGASEVIIFNSERFDQNSDYNTSTGIFTAPVTGKYYLQAQVLVNSVSNGQKFDLNCVTSNLTFTFGSPGRLEVQPGTVWNDSTKYIALGGNCLMDMDAGDTAKIYFGAFGGGSVYTGTSWTYFSGYLAC